MREELAQRLAEAYQIPLDRAKAALILTQGDLLEAACLLEREDPQHPGKVGSYSTAIHAETALMPAQVPQSRGRMVWEALLRALKGMFTHPTANYLEVSYPGGGVVDIPLLAAVGMALFAFWISALLLVLGWLVGCRFAFCGDDVDLPWLNRFLDAVCDARGQIFPRRGGKK